MGQYGVGALLIEAGSLYEMNCGCRQRLDSKKILITNSLLLDYLKANGLKISRNDFTRDIITINFGYGSRSYEDERRRLKSLAEQNPENEYYVELLKQCDENKDKYSAKSADEIRRIFYRDGVKIKYKDKEITYRMAYRSPGAAKRGSCVFIRSSLWKKAHDYMYMGMKLPKHNAKIIESSAYASLVASTIVDKIEINPEDILVVKDIDSAFKTNIISVQLAENGHLEAVHQNDVEVKNTCFDGQSLIDLSVFPKWADGYVLLREHMMKSAAFATDLKAFFRDYYGDKYETATIDDMWGNPHRVKDIVLVTTDASMKWLKFDISYEQWCEKVHENSCMFGIVKSNHPSKWVPYQRTSYQIVNSCDIEGMDDMMTETKEYIHKLKTDIHTFLEFLKRGANFANDYEVLAALYYQDHTFEQSEYFRSRKKEIIYQYTKSVKSGKLLQNADNMTIVGSPYAMLLHCVGEDIENDPEFTHEDGCIQCYTQKFGDEYLAAFRSPHNSGNNIMYFHNVPSPYIDKYFRLGNLCIAVNMIHTDSQARSNGADQDSDFYFVTNQKSIVARAKYAYNNMPTIVNNIPANSKQYDRCPESYAAIDNLISSQRMNIGESSNVAQLCQSYDHTYHDQKYSDYCCILAVVAQCCIDSAKKSFGIDLTNEIKYIREQLDVKTMGYPQFWTYVVQGFSRDRINPELTSPMCYLSCQAFESYRSNTPTLPMSHFFLEYPVEYNKTFSKRIEKLITDYSLDLYNSKLDADDETSSQYLLMKSDFEQLVEEIRRMVLPSKYIGLMSWLINRAFLITPRVTNNQYNVITRLNKNKALLLKVLYDVNPECLLKIFSKNVKK